MNDRTRVLNMLDRRMEWLEQGIAEAVQSGTMTVRDSNALAKVRDVIAVTRADMFGAETSYDFRED